MPSQKYLLDGKAAAPIIEKISQQNHPPFLSFHSINNIPKSRFLPNFSSFQTTKENMSIFLMIAMTHISKQFIILCWSRCLVGKHPLAGRQRKTLSL
jgi:hypothetical protein